MTQQDPYKTPESNPPDDLDCFTFLRNGKMIDLLGLDRIAFKRLKGELFKKNKSISMMYAKFGWICMLSNFAVYGLLRYYLGKESWAFCLIATGVFAVIFAFVLFGRFVNPKLYKLLKEHARNQ